VLVFDTKVVDFVISVVVTLYKKLAKPVPECIFSTGKQIEDGRPKTEERRQKKDLLFQFTLLGFLIRSPVFGLLTSP